MSRRSRFALFLGGAALTAVALAAWGDRRAPLELLPAGPALAVEVSGAAQVLESLEGTRFAAAFAAGPTYAWLEQGDFVQAIDALRTGIGRATGFTPRRRQLLDLAGQETAAAWYPPLPGSGTTSLAAAPWIAVARLRWRTWPFATAARIALRFGLRGSVPREDIADATVFTVGSGHDAMHFFFVGRLLVAAGDRGLIQSSARLAAGGGQALIDTEAWKRTFSPLPTRGDLRLWARGDLIPSWGRLPPRVSSGAAGVVLSAGAPVTIDIFLDAPDPSFRGDGPGAPPALALDGPTPLIFHSAAGQVPRVLADMFEDRAAAVARRRGAPPPVPLALRSGFALAVTSAEEGGLFPRPHGILAVGMRDADAAREALRRLFPPGSRSAPGRWGTALTTRESLPLAGEFDLWGAAAGERLVLATQQELIERLAPGKAISPGGAPPDDRALDSITALNVTKLFPVLRRYAPPLAGLLRARYREAPDISRDFDLLAAIRAVAVTTGTSPAGTLARITLEVGDLPAAR